MIENTMCTYEYLKSIWIKGNLSKKSALNCLKLQTLLINIRNKWNVMMNPKLKIIPTVIFYCFSQIFSFKSFFDIFNKNRAIAVTFNM